MGQATSSTGPGTSEGPEPGSQGAVENRGRCPGPQGSGGEQGSLGSVLQDETGPEGEHWQQVMSSGEIGGQGTETGQAGEDKPRQEAGTGSGPDVRRGLGEAGGVQGVQLGNAGYLLTLKAF